MGSNWPASSIIPHYFPSLFTLLRKTLLQVGLSVWSGKAISRSMLSWHSSLDELLSS